MEMSGGELDHLLLVICDMNYFGKHRKGHSFEHCCEYSLISKTCNLQTWGTVASAMMSTLETIPERDITFTSANVKPNQAILSVSLDRQTESG